ncbi:retrovirus-related pol polyprotein from transposon TNT 1-94 [Tanacetum coccineum]
MSEPSYESSVSGFSSKDAEEVSDDEEVIEVKVLMALADDELIVGKNHAHNGEWIDITIRKLNILISMDEDADWQNYLKDELLILKQAKLDAVNFQIQNTKLTKLNHALQEQLKEEKKINEKWLTSSKKGYDHEMVPKSKDWVERLNPDSKLLNFNTRRILVPDSQVVNESLKPTKASTDPESSKDSKAESLTSLSPLKILQGASPSTKVNSTQKTQESKSQIQQTKSSKSVDSLKISQPKVQNSDSSKILYCTICKKEDHRTSDHEMYNASLKRSENYKARPYQYASPSKQILKAKAKPFPPCTHYGFNDHIPDDYRYYHECDICRSYDHFTSRHNHVIHIKGGVLAESSQSSESLIGVKCNTCGSTVHSTTDHNEFDHFKRETHQGAHLVLGKWMLKEYDWCQELSAQICRATRKCLHLLHMDLFGPVSPMSINHKKYTLVIVDEYSRMVENQNDIKVKQIRTDNGTEFRNHELESFCDEKGISQNFSSPYTPEQNGVAERKNKTLIEAARIMLNGSVLSKHFWTEADHLGKFDAKADDGYFLGYSFISKAFRVFNTRRQQVEETYHVTFDESIEAIRFTNTSVDDIGVDDSFRYPPNKFIHEDDPSRKYQANYDISYYVIPHGPSGNNIEVLVSIIKSLVPNVPQSQISNQASTSMLTRSMAAKLTATSASECLFADFLSEIEPKKVSEVLNHPRWVDAMQEELN